MGKNARFFGVILLDEKQSASHSFPSLLSDAITIKIQGKVVYGGEGVPLRLREGDPFRIEYEFRMPEGDPRRAHAYWISLYTSDERGNPVYTNLFSERPQLPANKLDDYVRARGGGSGSW